MNHPLNSWKTIICIQYFTKIFFLNIQLLQYGLCPSILLTYISETVWEMKIVINKIQTLTKHVFFFFKHLIFVDFFEWIDSMSVNKTSETFLNNFLTIYFTLKCKKKSNWEIWELWMPNKTLYCIYYFYLQ